MAKTFEKLGNVLDKQELPKRARDLTGVVFGRLTVVAFAGRNKQRELLWQCNCTCGNTIVIRMGGLITKTLPTRSCGCIRAEFNKVRAITHGRTKEPIYTIWANMIDRCYSLRNKSYAYYGGRGIEVHGLWKVDFQAFYEHVSALPHFGDKGYTLDRINNNANYEPSNVRWSTHSQQMRNTNRNHLITHNGKTQCLQAWAIETGIHRYTIYSRLKAGWDIGRALTVPGRQKEMTG